MFILTGSAFLRSGSALLLVVATATARRRPQAASSLARWAGDILGPPHADPAACSGSGACCCCPPPRSVGLSAFGLPLWRRLGRPHHDPMTRLLRAWRDSSARGVVGAAVHSLPQRWRPGGGLLSLGGGSRHGPGWPGAVWDAWGPWSRCYLAGFPTCPWPLLLWLGTKRPRLPVSCLTVELRGAAGGGLLATAAVMC